MQRHTPVQIRFSETSHPGAKAHAFRLLVASTACILAFLSIMAAHAGEAEKPGPILVVSFEYLKQSGYATNQFAVWVENADGETVRTIYVTAFVSSRGGWRIRPNAVPLWVKQSGIADMKREEVDAITGPTPGSGIFGREWDLKDAHGELVPPGEYAVLVEGTLRDANRVLYRAPIKIGNETVISRPDPEFFGDHLKERNMITNVEIRYLP